MEIKSTSKIFRILNASLVVRRVKISPGVLLAHARMNKTIVKYPLVTDKPLLWFKNAQDANMKIFRWRLKLAEYDYDVVYKAGKINVSADALSRNPINFEEVDCNVIKYNKFLNPNNPKEIIRRNNL